MTEERTKDRASARDRLEAEVSYLLPTSLVNRRYVTPRGQLNTSRYEQRTVVVRDARPAVESFSFDSHGFMLRSFPTEAADFADAERIERVYMPETVAFAKQLLGADLVLSSAWMKRSSREGIKDAHPPANDVHVDYTPELSEWMARMVLEKHGVTGYEFDHFIAINCWRSSTPAPQDWPLGLCDARSVRADEGAVHGIVHVDALPALEDVPEHWPTGPDSPRSYDFSAFRYSADHEWFYFSDMTPDEVVLFKNYDSRRGPTMRVPHAGFRDRSCPPTGPRQSVEVRLVAYFR